MSNKENDSLAVNINGDKNETNRKIPKKRGRSASEDRQDLEEKREAALNQIKYLLSICETYSEIYKNGLLSTNKRKQTKRKSGPTLDDIEDIKTELKEKPQKTTISYNITQHLTYFEGGTLHPYQIEGVTWLYMLFANGTNGILADEMGLGKTIQIIALICVLLKKNVTGPFLIVAPLSTIPNWKNEFKKFAPKVPVVVLCGGAASRKENLKKIFMKYTIGAITTFPVVIVSFQIPLMEDRQLQKLKWKYIIVDEGQRIKNHKSQLAIKLRQLNSDSRLVLSGTPLQNNLMELWSLLNFILPNFFKNMETFTQLFMIEDMQNEESLIKQEESNNLVSKIHKVLAPFMLRRLKKDVLNCMVPKKELFVYCPMSDLQVKLYEYVIERNIAALKGQKVEEKIDVNAPRAKRKCSQVIRKYETDSSSDSHYEDEVITESDIKTNNSEISKFNKKLTFLTMQNTLMMFRKIVSHPYLIHFPLDPKSATKKLLIDEELINASGKFKVLDTLLPHLQKRGHKILLFSQLCMTLDLIEELLIMRNMSYRRLDGSHSIDAREKSIDDFNNDSSVFIFLLSTRAGGLGLNLVAADTVIFFDRDWNPQVDIQAQDRCHRIGQTKPVVVYTLVSKNTIDEKVLQVGKMKRLLERVIISDGKFQTIQPQEGSLTKDMLLELRKALKTETPPDFYILSNKNELNRLLDRSDLYKLLKKEQEEK